MKLFAYSMVMTVAMAYGEPNPPHWDTKSVKVFSPGQHDAQSIVDSVWNEQGGHNPGNHGQWSNDRYVLMFEPGYHNVNVNVGFYTQVVGLGRKPTDTEVNNLYSPNGSYDYTHGALCNFWRSVENFKVHSSYSSTVTYAVSQASPMRRMHIEGNLNFFQSNGGPAGYASGGFVSDSYISGSMSMGSQQQFFVRNCEYSKFNTGAWNFVQVGVKGAPGSHCSHSGGIPNTRVDKTPVIREKPYIIMDGSHYKLMKPKVEFNKYGHTQNWQNADEIDFSQVYVASQSDSADHINSKLEQGLHLVLQPGQYKLDKAIKVNKANTVVLGLGIATLISEHGNACIEVGDVDGVTVSGILFQAGSTKADSLLKWGSGSHAGSSSNPGAMHDIFARVGGPNDSRYSQVSARTMVEINSGNVIVDDAWLWRADHDVGGSVMYQRNPVANGIVVNGDHVTAYGLAAEHTLEDLVDWQGNHGSTYFYQAEFPYDVDSKWNTKWAGYYVGDNVTDHKAYGVGVYSFFRDHYVQAERAIKAPSRSGVQFTNSLAVFLSGQGGIKHVINETGSGVSSGHRQQYQCSYTEANDELAELFL